MRDLMRAAYGGGGTDANLQRIIRLAAKMDIVREILPAIIHRLTFASICEFVASGTLKYEDISVDNIISLLEQEGVERTSHPRDMSGDVLVRTLEIEYNQSPSKQKLLSYAIVCQRRGIQPSVDFCILA